MGDRKDVAKEVKKLWASNVSAYIMTLGMHQNVRGHKFYEEKLMWKEIYKYLQKQNSKLGNVISWLDQIVPASIERIQEETLVKDLTEVPDYVDMGKAGYEALKECRGQAEKIHEMCDELKWPGICSVMGDYCMNLDKYMFWCEATTVVVDTKDEGDDKTDAEGNKNPNWKPEPL
jgi:DNA-binding ferritin-like protein